MKKILKRGLALVLALIMVTGLLPVNAFAAVDSFGKPTDLNNELVLSIYTGTDFPGEPAVYGTGSYKNINSSFAVRSGATFASTANDQLNWEKINNAIVQGSTSGNTSVWGVYDANGTKDYFLSDASIIKRENEIRMICAVKGIDEAEAQNYEIIWYVIKLQHNPGGWFSRQTTEWHVDGVIKEKEKISINYYGNGNTSGNAPPGITNHTAGEPYTVSGKNTMVKKINGVEVAFLGWSAKADGTGEEQGFYQPGAVINPTKSISLYAMWDTTTQYTATVNTYLDGVLTSDSAIHRVNRNLALGTEDGSSKHYYDLTEDSTGVYTVKITGNGKFHLYCKNQDGTYTQIGNHQLTIYNQNASLDVHHYSVTYDANGGTFAADPGKLAYNYGEAVTAVPDTPTMEGCRFLGWNTKDDGTGNMIQAGGEVTASITEPIKLYAQWEKTVNVTINVTINHEGGDGYDQAPEKDHVSLTIASRADQNSPYLEVDKTLNLTNTVHPGFQYSVDGNVTKYEGYTLTDMPGGNAEYTAVTSKSGYETSVEQYQDVNGNWIINVEMTYEPSNFDVKFNVEVDKAIPADYVPDAAIAKVTFWATGKGCWEIITQQAGGAPGVRVDIDPNTRSGSGSYPVWKYESNSENPYGYRVQVTSFVYPDGTIVPVSDVVTQDVAWTDNVYTATMDTVTGGKKFVTLDGAYYDKASDSQLGNLNVKITMDLHDVIFDAQGGKVNGEDIQTAEDQYKIPSFKDYVPTREGGYTFGGWYEDQECTKAATEGADLTKDITLYAKWIEPLAISGTVTIFGSYEQNGVNVPVNDIDRATEAIVLLQENRGGTIYDVDSTKVLFHYGESNSAATNYRFDGIPNENKNYQIHVLILNYGTAYDNEGDADSDYSPNEYTAEFGDNNEADVDAQLTFVPPSYYQPLRVDATQIGEGFRPDSVLSAVMYRDTGDNHPFNRISQHKVAPYGVEITLDSNGNGDGTQSIWKWHTDGTLYDYQMNISEVDGKTYDSNSAPYYITYADVAYWNASADAPSGELKATLIPKQYLVTFDLNAEGDPVTGVEKVSYTDEEGNLVITDIYGVVHTWSFDTAINAVPQREGYTFTGWTADVEDAYTNDKIVAAIHQEVTLTAQWEKNAYQVTTAADPEVGGATAGDGTYTYGEQVTVTATPNTGYNFCGWYEGDTLVSADREYTFTITSNQNLTARFARNPYAVTANTSLGGTTTGTGIYEYGQTATVVATADEGYAFRGWFEGLEQVSDEASYSFTVTSDRTLTAQFSKVYTITAIAETGGSVSGGGAYEPMANATITAEANGGYYFIGWYDEEGELITAKTSHSLTVKEDRTFTAKFEKKVSYYCDYVYIFGYNDTKISAEGPLLRGELAQMIYRLVKQNSGAGHGDITFSDTAGEWFRTGISYMAKVGAIDQGKPQANPFVSVTRGETYKMICLGLGFTTDASLNYSDYATILRNSGYLSDDGRVTAKISRWEFCALFNAILGRSGYGLVDTEGNTVTHETYNYTDLDPSADYYRTMLIATSTYDTNGRVDMALRAQRNPLDEYGG